MIQKRDDGRLITRSTLQNDYVHSASRDVLNSGLARMKRSVSTAPTLKSLTERNETQVELAKQLQKNVYLSLPLLTVCILNQLFLQNTS